MDEDEYHVTVDRLDSPDAVMELMETVIHQINLLEDLSDKLRRLVDQRWRPSVYETYVKDTLKLCW